MSRDVFLKIKINYNFSRRWKTRKSIPKIMKVSWPNKNVVEISQNKSSNVKSPLLQNTIEPKLTKAQNNVILFD